MSTKSKRATIYFEPSLHKALRLKSIESEQSVSDLVNEAVRSLLQEDAEDLEAIKIRVNEPTIDFAEYVKDLKARGEL